MFQALLSAEKKKKKTKSQNKQGPYPPEAYSLIRHIF